MLLGTRMEDVGFAGQVSSVYAVTNFPYRKIHRLRISNRKAQERSSAPVGASNDFYYLKVAVKFFKDRLKQFHIVQSKTIGMYLSADKNNLFEEIRGTGKGHEY